MIPAFLGSLLLVNIAAVQNLLKGRHPAAMVAFILGSLGLIALIFKYVPAESF